MVTDITKSVRLLTKRIGQLPGFRRPITRLWNTYEHLKFTYYVRRQLRSEDRIARIDPYRIYWIDPGSVKRMTESSFDSFTETAKTTGGDWDRDPVPLEESPIYNRFYQRFREGIPWKETENYRRLAESIRDGTHPRYATLEELHEKFRQYEDLYEKFNAGTYRMQSELAEEGSYNVPGDGGRALFPSLTDHTLLRHEISVNVGRNGTLLRNDGRHRLALALLAGLEEVPVRIVVRHTQWQSLRDDVARTIDEALEAGLPPEDVPEYVEKTLVDDLGDVSLGLDHPDLEVIFERRLPNK